MTITDANLFTTLSDLLWRAAKSLQLAPSSWEEKQGSARVVLADYVLTEPDIQLLEKNGYEFVHYVGEDLSRLRDTTYEAEKEALQTQKPVVWLVNGTILDMAARHCRLMLCANLSLDEAEKGIRVEAEVRHAHFRDHEKVAPKANLRLFKILTERDPDAPYAAKFLSLAEEGVLLCDWKIMELEGLRSVDSLFHEFANGKKILEALARHTEVFDPRPEFQFDLMNLGEKQFLLLENQQKVVSGWQKQLENMLSELGS